MNANNIRQSQPLSSDRVGSVVCWFAHGVSVNADTLRKSVLSVRRASSCSTCGAASGQTCNPGMGTVDGEGMHDARLGALCGVVGQASSNAVAMTRAIARQRKNESGLSWRRGEQDGHRVPLVLVEDQRVNARTSQGDAVARALWTLVHDEASGSVVVPSGLDEEEQRAVDSLLERYEVERSTLTAQDVTAMLVDLMHKLGGFALNGGGTYFVPREADEVMEALRVGGALDCASYRLSVLDVLAGREDNVRAAAEDALLANAREIARMANAAREKMDAFMLANGKGKGVGKPRFSAVTDRLGEIASLRSRGKALARLLGATIGEMESALAEAEASSKQVLSDLSITG